MTTVLASPGTPRRARSLPSSLAGAGGDEQPIRSASSANRIALQNTPKSAAVVANGGGDEVRQAGAALVVVRGEARIIHIQLRQMRVHRATAGIEPAIDVLAV